MNRGQSCTQSVTHCSLFHPPQPHPHRLFCSLLLFVDEADAFLRKRATVSQRVWLIECTGAVCCSHYAHMRALALVILTLVCLCYRKRSARTSERPSTHSSTAPESRATSGCRDFVLTTLLRPWGEPHGGTYIIFPQVSALLIHSHPSDLCWCWPVTSPNSLTGP